VKFTTKTKKEHKHLSHVAYGDREVHPKVNNSEENVDDKMLNVPKCSCYRGVCDIPQTYQDAIASTKSKQWKTAMNEEMRSLQENKTSASPRCHQASRQWGAVGSTH